MTDCAVSVRFLEGLRGRILLLARIPRRARHGAVLIVPPFAEEMNKSRWMYAEVGRKLADLGVPSVLPDLYGTGDSDGEFRDADWEVWLDDLARVSTWMLAEGQPVKSLLCTRLGCILGAEAAGGRMGQVERTVFWQPVMDGQRFLTQFLRLRVAASMMNGNAAESVAGLRERLRNAGALEIAGYEVSARLAEQIDQRKLQEIAGLSLGDLHWMDIVTELEGASASPAQRSLGLLEARGSVRSARLHTIAGDPFWTSTEIVRNPDLIARTVGALATG